MRVLVTGSRTIGDRQFRGIIHALLTGLFSESTVGHLTTELSEFVIMEGGGTGADDAADWWAESSPMHSHNESPDDPRFEHLRFPVDWRLGKRAGPMRNRQMLKEGRPEMVLAFVDKPLGESRGTESMVDMALDAGVPVYVVRRYKR